MPGNPKKKQRSALRSLLLFLLLIILTLGVFGDCVFVFVLDKPDRSKWTRAQTELGEIQKALNRYALDHDGAYPDSLRPIEQLYFKTGMPKDPFTKDVYLYERTETGFVLTCFGADMAEGGDERPMADIVFDETGLVEH
ncbi:MAG: type II secretion system protein GspG [Planctomycetes bacterium]|nr:type II secretion system protein GspG [Planctomycetota bacterium]